MFFSGGHTCVWIFSHQQKWSNKCSLWERRSRKPGGHQTADYSFHDIKARGDFHPSPTQCVSSSSLHPGSTSLFSCLTRLCLMDGSPLIISLWVILFKPEGGLAMCPLLWVSPGSFLIHFQRNESGSVEFCPIRCSCSIPSEQMELLPNWNELMSFAPVLTLNFPVIEKSVQASFHNTQQVAY